MKTFYVTVSSCTLILSNYIMKSWNWYIEKYFLKKQLPRCLIDKYTKELLGKILAPKTILSTIHKQDLVITLPYLGKLSHQTQARINCILKTNSLTAIFSLFSGLSWLFFLHPKTIKLFFHSGMVYQFQCHLLWGN